MVVSAAIGSTTPHEAGSAIAAVRFDRVLFPTDFSSSSQRALPYVSQIAASCCSHLDILHVVAESPAVPETVPDFIPHVYQPNRHEAEKQIRQLENSGLLSQIDHSFILDSGPLQDVIENTARLRQVELVVMGTRGREGIKKILLGSVAEIVSRRARCAVLIAGPHVPPTTPAHAVRRILYATKFIGREGNSLRYAASIAGRYSAELTVLHVCRFLDGPRFADNASVIDNETEKLKTALASLVQLRPVPNPVVQIGIVPDTIVRIASESHADLIIMGAHSRHAPRVATHMPWDITHQVICHAICPVLTVPE